MTADTRVSLSEVTPRWWALLALIPMGVGSGPAFMYAGSRARHRHWFVVGVVYLVLAWGSVAALAIIGEIDEDSIWRNVAGVVATGTWLLSIAHVGWIWSRSRRRTGQIDRQYVDTRTPVAENRSTSRTNHPLSWVGFAGASRSVLMIVAIVNVPFVALLVTGGDASDDFQLGFVWFSLGLGLVAGTVVLGARVAIGAFRRPRPVVNRRRVASSLVIGLLLGWPWPATSDLPGAPRLAGLLVNTVALVMGFGWWMFEVGRPGRNRLTSVDDA